MHTLLLCIAAASVGIHAGWQRMPEGGMQYIIQLDPETLQSLREGAEIESDIPPSAGEVRSYKILMGTRQLPRETPPAPKAAARTSAKKPGGTVAPAKGTAPAAAAAPAATAPAGAPAQAPVLVLRPMLPREELFVVRSACGGDVRALCGGVAPGGGRIMQCLATQTASISAACREVLGQFAAQ